MYRWYLFFGGQSVYFLSESDSLVKVLRELHCYKNCVVSTGGGIVIERENWSYMQQGIVVWLSGSSKLLAKRLTHTGVESRPLLADCEDVNGVVEKLDGILLERYFVVHCSLSFKLAQFCCTYQSIWISLNQVDPTSIHSAIYN